MSDKEILQGKEFAIRAISVFRVKFNMEFTRQAVNFSIAVTLRFAHGEKFLNSFNDRWEMNIIVSTRLASRTTKNNSVEIVYIRYNIYDLPSISLP